MIEAQADRGTAIVMDSSSGAILAVASYPGFDPNRYRQFSRAHFLNRAVTSGYEPGSTFKIITLSAALSEGLISVDQNFDCENGEYKVGGHRIRDVKKHQQLSLLQVLKKSSNICAAKIGMRLSPHVFQDYIKNFGFGSRPDSGLAAEAPGKLLPAKKWTAVDHASISFGQGILVSPLQMLVAINVFANQGKLVTPFTVQHAIDASGNSLKQIDPPGGSESYRFGPKESKGLLNPGGGFGTGIHDFRYQEGGTARRASIEGIRWQEKQGPVRFMTPSWVDTQKLNMLLLLVVLLGKGSPGQYPGFDSEPQKIPLRRSCGCTGFQGDCTKNDVDPESLPEPSQPNDQESIRVSRND